MSDTTASYEAIVAAFCLISYADGELHTAEVIRFIHALTAESEFRHIDKDRLQADIDDQIKALDRDFAKAKSASLEKIQGFKNDYKTMQTVIKVARIALISDDRILEAEEALLAEIHRALGLTEKI